MIVRVEDVFPEFRVAGYVDLGHALGRDAVEILIGVEIVVPGRHVDVVDIEKNPAISQLHDFVEEFPFGHLGYVKLGVAAHVFDGDRIGRRS
jgi:hypothetical protein